MLSRGSGFGVAPEIKFAGDSLLEGDGFEPSVPLYILTVSDPLLVGLERIKARMYPSP
jgi:hypothetical protein